MAKFNVPTASEGVLIDNFFSRAWSKFFDEVWRKIGGGKGYNLGGLVTADTTAVGNVGAGEDDLIVGSLEKNVLNNSGDTLEFKTFGIFANNTNTKRIRAYLGSTVILDLTGTTTVFQNKEWNIDTTVIRTGSATQKVVSVFSTFGVVFTEVTSATEDFTVANTIKVTGEATATNDIVQSGLVVKLFPVI